MSKWDENRDFEVDPNNKEKKFVTVAYPYPNSPQHIGHGRTYSIADVNARFLRMKGFNVLFPMGFHYTGTPILGMAKRVQGKDKELIKNFQEIYGVPEEKIKEFEEPIKIASYFHHEIKSGMKEMGYSIDWRREFTTIDPGYKKFIEWQFNTLKKSQLIVQGSHPVGWCPKDHNPVSQHDTLGDMEPDFTEYVLIKLKMNDMIIPVATLRPETIFGVTNVWINPNSTYQITKVNEEKWLVSEECAYKLEFQDKKIEKIGTMEGRDLLGKKVEIPKIDRNVIILPANFVKNDTGTGVVMSVPAHAPFDFQALKDLQDNLDQIKEVTIQDEISKIKPIKIIDSDGLKDIPAEEIISKFDIKNQDDPKLEDATKELYSKEFYEGKLNAATEQFQGKNISEIKDSLKNWILENSNGDIFLEFNNSSIRCRCGTACVVKLLKNQWFLNYSNPQWKEKTANCYKEMSILPSEIRQEFFNVLDWLKERACARQQGLGTNVPWDKNWIVESLSDSVIYMSYYIISKFVNLKKIEPEKLSDQFFDYVFLEIGNSSEISKKVGINEEVLREIKNEFRYFYPVDARHSGRDLVPNHLSFFVLNHVAIFPPKNWPRGIIVNGSVLMDGKKMSKSMGNIIPLREAIKKFGADPIRLSILISAELLQDADFNFEVVKGIENKLENFIQDSLEYKNVEIQKVEPEDIWLDSKTQELISLVTDSIEKMRLREALHRILYDFDNELQWYKKRVLAKKRDDFGGKYHNALCKRFQMLSPFAPFVAEELWKNLGKEGFVSNSNWPIIEKGKINIEILMKENLLKSVLNDLHNILKVTNITPKKIIIYTADSEKSKIYFEILKMILDGSTQFGLIMKKLISKQETEYIKRKPDLVKKIIKDILSDSQETRIFRNKVGRIDELELFKLELSSLIEKDFGVSLQVFQETDNSKYDPKNKASTARLYKPAILIE